MVKLTAVQKPLAARMNPAQRRILAQVQKRFSSSSSKAFLPSAETFQSSGNLKFPVSVLAQLQVKIARKLRAYSPDEARDSSGKWTEGGDNTDAYKQTQDEWTKPARDLLDTHGLTALKKAGVDTDHLTPEQEEKWSGFR